MPKGMGFGRKGTTGYLKPKEQFEREINEILGITPKPKKKKKKKKKDAEEDA